MSEKGNEYPGFTVLTEAEAAKVNMGAVKWEEKVIQRQKNTLHNLRRVEYDVAGVGTVAEEWRVSLVSIQGKTSEEKAFHSVYVNGQLVRQVDMKTGLKVVNNAAFEPFDFLRYDAFGSTEASEKSAPKQLAKGEKVPVVQHEGKGSGAGSGGAGSGGAGGGPPPKTNG